MLIVTNNKNNNSNK